MIAANTLLLENAFTSTEWALNNPILPNKVLGYDTTLKRYKMGDGTTNWSNLQWWSYEENSPIEPIEVYLKVGQTIPFSFALPEYFGGKYILNAKIDKGEGIWEDYPSALVRDLLSVTTDGTGQITDYSVVRVDLYGSADLVNSISLDNVIFTLSPAATSSSSVIGGKDVFVYATYTDFPPIGETSKLYIAKDTNRIYTWNGGAYQQAYADPAGGLFKTTDAAPLNPLENQYYELIGTGNGSNPSGTYTNLLSAPSTPLVIPAAATGHTIINAKAIYKNGFWSPVWQDVVLPNVDTANLATNTALNAVQAQIATVTGFTYPAPMPFRLYTAQNTFVTTSTGVSQADNGETVTMARSAASSNLHVTYFRTGHSIVETTGYYKTAFTFNSISTGNVLAPGIGCIRPDSTAFGYALRTKTSGTVCDLIKVDDYSVTLIDAAFENFTLTDTIELRVILGSTHQLAVYKNGNLVKAVTLPEKLTGELCHCQRGAFSYNATKVKQFVDKLASVESVAANTSAISNLSNVVNPNGVFLKTATFLSQVQGNVGLDLSYLKRFVKAIQLYGFQNTDKISPFVVRRNSSTNANKWQIVFIKDNGDGTGISANRQTVMTWSDPTHVEPPAGQWDVIEYNVGGAGFKAYVDWQEVTVGDHGSANYNSAGFDSSVYINFKSSNIVAASGVRIMWPYNNTDAPTTGTNFYKGWTVLPNKNEANQTIGCTGASYNIHTDEFVITRYEYERQGALWFYDRKDLVDYTSSGTINPTPTRIMPIPTSYAYHLQGNLYDPELKCYWLVGALNAVSSDTERVLVRIDNEGRLIEKYLLPYNTEAGMIVLSPDYQNILYKPNNSGTLYEFNKYTKALVRSQTGFNTNEGLGMDYDSKVVWISGDNGECKTYDYSTLTLINSYTFATLPNTASGTNTEGMVIINGMPYFIFDGFLHGSNNNGNAMFLFDFAHIIGKALYFPNQMPLYNKGASGSVVVDFGATNDLAAATLLSGTGTLQYRGSNTAPTTTVVNRVNWLDRPFYASWGDTVPSAWSATFAAFRYMEIKVV